MANIVMHIPQNEGEEKTYILEFNRRIILKMEANGIIEKLQGNIEMESVDELVYYACLKNQPNITKEEVRNIVDSVSLAQFKDFIEAIAKLLEKSISALEETEKSGNAHWEVN